MSPMPYEDMLVIHGEFFYLFMSMREMCERRPGAGKEGAIATSRTYKNMYRRRRSLFNTALLDGVLA